MGESEEFVQRGLWGRSGFCLLEMRRGVSQTSKWLCSSSLSGQAKKSGGESSFNFLPATSARAAKNQSARPWEAGRRLGDGCAQPVGMAAPTPTRSGVLDRDAGHGKPLPCAPALANGAWRGPAAAPGCSEIPRPNRVAARGPDPGCRARSLQRPLFPQTFPVVLLLSASPAFILDRKSVV